MGSLHSLSFSSHGFEFDSPWHFADAWLGDATVGSSHIHIAAGDLFYVILILLALPPVASALPLRVAALLVSLVLFLDVFGKPTAGHSVSLVLRPDIGVK